jgi:hypothetical protein
VNTNVKPKGAFSRSSNAQSNSLLRPLKANALVDLELLGGVMPKAEALSTRARWSAVGTYSAVTLRFQSLNQGTRARYTESGPSLGCDLRLTVVTIFSRSVFCFDVCDMKRAALAIALD